MRRNGNAGRHGKRWLTRSARKRLGRNKPYANPKAKPKKER